MRCVEIRKLDLKRNSDYIILSILLYNLALQLKYMGRKVDSLLFLQKAMTIHESNSPFCKMGANIYESDFTFSCMYQNSNIHVGLQDRYLMKSYGDHIKYAIKADIYQAYLWQLQAHFLKSFNKIEESKFAMGQYEIFYEKLYTILENNMTDSQYGSKMMDLHKNQSNCETKSKASAEIKNELPEISHISEETTSSIENIKKSKYLLQEELEEPVYHDRNLDPIYKASRKVKSNNKAKSPPIFLDENIPEEVTKSFCVNSNLDMNDAILINDNQVYNIDTPEKSTLKPTNNKNHKNLFKEHYEISKPINLSLEKLKNAEIIFDQKSRFDTTELHVRFYHLSQDDLILVSITNSLTNQKYEKYIEFSDLVEFAKATNNIDLLVDKNGLKKLFKKITRWMTLKDGNLSIGNVSIHKSPQKQSPIRIT